MGGEGEKYGHDHERVEKTFMTGIGGGDNVGQDSGECGFSIWFILFDQEGGFGLSTKC